jgi:hypothetical protein
MTQPLITGEVSPFFVTLPNYNATINLAAIVLVDWAVVPEEYVLEGYIATVHLSTRTHIYIGPDDALHLQDALENYNQASGRDDINRNRTTFQQSTSKQSSNQKVAVAANGSSGGGAARR